MIYVREATLESYGGVKIAVKVDSIFHEPLWKVKDLILDRVIRFGSDDPIVKVIKLNYREYGKEN